MAELFMECEEEELEPWQQKSKPIVVDDDDDDDEPIFVGEILSSKPASTYILNRVNPNSSRTGLQNGAPKTGAVPVSPGFQSTTRPATSTLAVQPQPRVSSLSGTAQALQRPPLSGCPSPQEAAKTSSSLSQTAGRTGTTPSLTRNLGIPVLAQSAFRPVATVTAQPATFNRGHTPGLAFGSRQNSGGSPCQSGSPVTTAGLSKRPSTSEANSTSPKKAKADELGPGSASPVLVSNDTSLLQKGATSTNPFPQACPKCNIHFNLLEPLKNHIKYCCPEMLSAFLGGLQPDCSGGTSGRLIEAESGKLIMLVNDFYYGKHEGNLQQVRQEQKTHTTFKCASCMKLLKSNIRFMNHMKHHLELEKQNSESWESHTTCQHCYRQFPTPFQLQCHIESTHTPHECSTICKICELSFETEQVLLQHMKDNHKPGEMPYVCQVCSYRSSAFSDVEKHFRTVHENTKNLLCPFCLKVIKIGAPYMHHFMRHQKKGVHRCTKCRLQFLTCKEKLDHKSQHHRTFKKPAQLEGLPPGTKVTIRASVGSLPPVAMATSPVNAHALPLQSSPVDKVTNTKSYHKASINKAKSKSKPLSLQKKQSAGSSASTSTSTSSAGSSNSGAKKHEKVANTVLNSLRCPDIQKCIECNSDIRTFASHFPAYVCCGLCRYKTSCSKAYVNHMMSFHSARQNKRFWIYRTRSDGLRGMTVVCLDCDFLSDDSALDQMATHLNDNDAHTCHIIMENVPGSLNSLTAADISDQSNNVQFTHESDEKPQELTRPVSSEEQEGPSVSQSSQIEAVAEVAKKDHVGKQRDEDALLTESDENKLPVEGPLLAPPAAVCAMETPMDSAEEEKPSSALAVQGSKEGALAAEAQEEPLPGVENVPGTGGHQGSPLPDCVEEGEADRHRCHEDEKECEGRKPSRLKADDPSLLEPGSCSKDSAAGEGEAGAPASQRKDPPSDVECGGKAPSSLGLLDPSCDSGSPSCLEEPGRAAQEGSMGPLEGQGLVSPVVECEGKACLLVPGDTSHAGPSDGGGCSEETSDGSGQEGLPDSPVTPGRAGLTAESLGSAASPPAPERDSPARLSLGSEDPGGSTLAEEEGEAPRDDDDDEEEEEEEEEEEGLPPQGGSCLSPPPACEEEKASSSPSVPEVFPTTLPSPGSMEAAGAIEGGGQESHAGHNSPACKEHASGLSPAESLPSGASEASPPSSPPVEEMAPPDPLGSPSGGGGGSPGSAEGKEQLQRSLAESIEGGRETPGGPAGEKASSSSGPGGQGEAASCPDSAEEEEALCPEEEEAQPGEAPSQDIQQTEGDDTDCPEPDTEREVSGFEQFLSMRGETSLANSEGSDQGSSAQLEPLTPSELLEHEATEILQKGGGGGRTSSSSSAVGGSGAEESEHTEGASSREGSPGPEAASRGPTEEAEDTGGSPSSPERVGESWQADGVQGKAGP